MQDFGLCTALTNGANGCFAFTTCQICAGYCCAFHDFYFETVKIL